MQTNQNQATAQQLNGQAVRPYPEMVERLFKNMDTAAASLVHATIGMSGEVAELIEGVHAMRAAAAGNRENIVEELGDFRFYMQKVWNIYGWEWDSFVLPAPNMDTFSLLYNREAFVIGTGAALDLAKKEWIYGKEVDATKLYDIMNGLAAAYRDILLWNGWHDDFICNENRAKLAKRYPEGVYSDAAAQARADKQENVSAERAPFPGELEQISGGKVYEASELYQRTKSA